jgi:hypothetical protein
VPNLNDDRLLEVSEWNKVMVAGGSEAFVPGRSRMAEEDFDREREKLRAKIGELTIDVHLFFKRLTHTCAKTGWWARTYVNAQSFSSCSRNPSLFGVPAHKAKKRGRVRGVVRLAALKE